MIAFPDQVTTQEDLKCLSEHINKTTGLNFELLRYKVKSERDPVDLGIAKIMTYMADLELEAVHKLTDSNMLGPDSMLLKDGPLRYKNLKGRNFDIIQFRNVIGLSKTFRPSFAIGEGRAKKDVGVVTSGLDMGERTTVYKTSEEDKYIGIWYLRIRPKVLMENPLQGVLKVECYATSTVEEENGFEHNRINTVSAHILRERNVSPYGQDSRWPTHLYPVFQTETYIKVNLLSDIHFRAIF